MPAFLKRRPLAAALAAIAVTALTAGVIQYRTPHAANADGPPPATARTSAHPTTMRDRIHAVSAPGGRLDHRSRAT